MFTKASPGKCKDYWSTFCFLKACRHDAARVSQSAEGSSPVLSWGPSGPCGDSLQLVVLLLAPLFYQRDASEEFEEEGRIVRQLVFCMFMISFLLN